MDAKHLLIGEYAPYKVSCPLLLSTWYFMCIFIRCADMGWQCALQRQKEIVKISVGAQAVNELLGGGIESRCITEIYGEFR